MVLELLGNVAPTDLVDARNALQNAVLLIAGAGEHLAVPQPDDSHRSFGWDAGLRAFRGVDLRGDFFIRIRTVDYVAEVIRERKILGSVELEGRSLSESLKALIALMPVETDFEISIFDDKLPDRRLLTHPLVLPNLRQCKQLALHYAHADVALRGLVEGEPDASPIRTWPHHFDMATILPGGPEGSTVGVGLSPGDGIFEEPYWYITPSPLGPDAPKVALPQRWEWNTAGWTGMVLTTSRMLARPMMREPNLGECVRIARSLIKS